MWTVLGREMNLDAIPQALKQRPQWCLWRYEERDGKRTKAPWQAKDPGRRASSTQPATWATFAEAVAGAEHADGIGYVFSPDDPFVGIDIDPDMPEDEAAEAVELLASYTERSPSGRGLHVIVRGDLPDSKGRRKGPVEFYNAGRYFTVTGDHLEGTPTTVEYRQEELRAVMARVLPAEPERPVYEPQPVAVDDQALIEKARNARRGVEFADLMDGRWEGRYTSQSEADLALCSKLAFWTGRDPERMDRIFRSSGLMREKWERADYRGATIEEAIAGCRDIYTLPRSMTNGASADPVSGGAATAGQVPLPAAAGSAEAPPVILRFTSIHEFAAVDEPSAEPLVGAGDTMLLSKGGMLLFYGDGGAGKTTLELDVLFHLAAGADWIGLPIGGTARIGLIENEGPRGMFRLKTRSKLANWDGGDMGDRLHVLDDPWAVFSFQPDAYRDALVDVIEELELDVIAAGPVNRLGMQGGGTPEEVGAFVYNIEFMRQKLSRPLAVVLAHHENKAGDVSGAWEGVPDTVVHVKQNGNGSTRLHWQKVRWGPALHGRTQVLSWTEGEGFAPVEEAEARSDSDIEADILAFVGDNPGAAWGVVRDAVDGQVQRLTQLRKQMLTSGKLENRGSPSRMALYVSGSPVPAVPTAWNQGSLEDGTEQPPVGDADPVPCSHVYREQDTAEQNREQQNDDDQEPDW